MTMMRKKTHLRALAALAVALALLLAACASQPAPAAAPAAPATSTPPATAATPAAPAPKQEIFVTVGGSVPGGQAYVLAAGMAEILTRKVDWITANPQAAAGSVAAHIPALAKGEVDIAFVTSDQAYDGLTGGARYGGEKFPGLRGVMGGGTTPLHVVVPAKSDIRSIADLEGKRVAIGAPGSATELMAQVALAAHGVKNIRAQGVMISESAPALRDGNIDALFYGSAIPLPGLVDLATTHDVRLLSIDQAVLTKLLVDNPFFVADTIPAGTYRGQDQAIATFGSTLLLASYESVPADVIYEIARVIFTSNDELVKVHPGGKDYVPANIGRAQVLPLHEGVKRYLKEQGINVE